MKARPSSVLLLAAALSASAFAPLFASSKNDSPRAYPIGTLIAASNGDMKVVRGASMGDVSYALRYKVRQELSPNVWAYSGFHANLDLANDQECGTVVITFVNGQVSDMRLVNKPAVAAIAANLKLGSSARNIASK
jgi:hypothetical protein